VEYQLPSASITSAAELREKRMQLPQLPLEQYISTICSVDRQLDEIVEKYAKEHWDFSYENSL
jgi:hypothetical protein